jgi:hypothetical protein
MGLCGIKSTSKEGYMGKNILDSIKPMDLKYATGFLPHTSSLPVLFKGVSDTANMDGEEVDIFVESYLSFTSVWFDPSGVFGN